MDESAAIAGSGNPLKSRFESKIQGKNILKIRQSVCLFTLLLTPSYLCLQKCPYKSGPYFQIALWEPRSGTLLIKIRAHEDAVNEIQFYPVISSKSVPIIFSVGDNSCRVWHPLRKRSKQLQIIKQHRLGLEV